MLAQEKQGKSDEFQLAMNFFFINIYIIVLLFILFIFILFYISHVCRKVNISAQCGNIYISTCPCEQGKMLYFEKCDK